VDVSGDWMGNFDSEWRRRWARPSWWTLLIVLPWVLGVTYDLYGWKHYEGVAAREQTVIGTITFHDKANHNQYRYVFSVAGKSYEALGGIDREPIVGEEVVVYYDPLDPTTSAIRDFKDLSSRSLGPVPLTVAGIIAVVVIIVRVRLSKPRVVKATQQ